MKQVDEVVGREMTDRELTEAVGGLGFGDIITIIQVADELTGGPINLKKLMSDTIKTQQQPK